MKMNKFLISTAILGGLVFLGGVHAEASEWTANTPKSIQIENDATSYQFKLGDTVWAVATSQNLQSDYILSLNGLNSESARTLPVNYTLSLTQNADGTANVTVQNIKGETISSGTATSSDKVDETKPFGSNPFPNEVSNSGSLSTDVNSAHSNNKNGGTTINHETPVKPPVAPEKKMVNVKIDYIDSTNGISLGQETQSLEVGTSATFNAKTFTGYTLASPSSQTITVSQGSEVIFTFTKNEVTPSESHYTVWYHGEGTTAYDISLGKHIFNTKSEAQTWRDLLT